MPEFLGSSNICSVSAKDVGTFAKHNNNEFCLFLKEKNLLKFRNTHQLIFDHRTSGLLVIESSHHPSLDTNDDFRSVCQNGSRYH